MEIINNYYRRFLGLKLLDSSNVCKTFEQRTKKYYVYFNKDKMVKIITVDFNEYYVTVRENDVDYYTAENGTILLPKTTRGKPRKITCSVLDNLNAIGPYFSFYKPHGQNGFCVIGNYTTQKSYYEETIREEIKTPEDIKIWLDKYVEETTEDDLQEIQTFATEERKHVKYQEGDYFRVKYGRHEFGYGRILLNIPKRRKNGMKYWSAVAGQPLIVEMFRIITHNKNMSVSDLENLPTFPSQHIFDNRFYYGDYEIIGNGKLPKKIKYPIMYGRSISARDPDKIIFQCGEIYREIKYNNNIIRRENEPITNDFRNSGIGFGVDINKEIVTKSIEQNSNMPYWEYYKYDMLFDLRSPKNKEYLLKVLKQFNLEYLYDLYKE